MVSSDNHTSADREDRIHAALADSADLLEELGVPGGGAALRAGIAALGTGGTATAVVVGETNQGKSSLVNALVEAPGLLPVSLDAATHVPLIVAHAAESSARWFGEVAPDGEAIEPERIAEYAALDPLTLTAARPDVDRVEVGVPAPLLEGGLVLIDTPGVGGLEAGHGEVTLAALALADALVFVSAADRELTRTELEFLRRAAGRVPTVLFVLTKTDGQAAAQDVLARNAARIADHVPGLARAPWYAVSSLHRDRAARLEKDGHAEKARYYRELSGFDRLEADLRDGLAARIAVDRRRALLRSADLALDLQQVDRVRRLADLAAGVSAEEELAGRLAALDALESPDAEWRGRLAAGLGSLEAELRRGIDTGLQDITRRTDRIIAAGGPDMPREAARDLADAVRALVLDLEAALFAGALSVVTDVCVDFDLKGVHVLWSELPVQAWVRDLPPPVTGVSRMLGAEGGATGLPVVPGEDDLRETVRELLPRLHAVGTVVGGALRTFPPDLRAPVVLAGVLVGVAAVPLLKRYVDVQTREELRAYADATIRRLRQQLPVSVSQGLDRVRADVIRQAGLRLAERRAELERERTGIVDGPSDADARRARLTAERDRIDAQRAVLQALLAGSEAGPLG